MGNPRQEVIKPLVELVLRRHKTPLTRENILGLANGLVVMRKDSKSGVTEIAILRHMAKTGSSRLTLAQQLGLSATLLE
ncbi:hypothetical protein [Fibrella aquatica]|uniref:hypothetical protein n=1 Tax=Fibrella aquatica TaxID=3242487 RepID=UPI0035228E11